MKEHGTTLVELLVVLLLLGIIVSLSAVGVTTLRPEESSPARQLDSARRAAAISGKAGVLRLDSTVVRVLPDGREIRQGELRLAGTEGQ